MKPRSLMPKTERQARSRLAKLCHDQPLLRGSLVTMARTCGNPRCRCARGEKHVSLYLSIRRQGMRKLIYVPRRWEDRARRSVEAWGRIQGLIDIVSEACLERLLRAKRSKD